MEKFLVIGNPIDHSLSPDLHNYWIKNSSIDAIYQQKKINENQLEQIITQVKDNKIKGILDKHSIEYKTLKVNDSTIDYILTFSLGL